MEEDYEVVISGMSGRFPNCKEADELKKNLFDQINLITDEGRWKAGEMEVPHQVGRLKDAYSFDLTYFGVARKIAEFMDPNVKNIMKCAVEAVVDAGINPSDIAGSNTATIASSSIHETECDISSSSPRKLSILMYANCMQANRIAYHMDLRGPSYVCQSEWNGGLYVLQYARRMVATGQVKAAVVATSSSMFQPHVSYHFNRLGRLNDDGKTKSFSNDADGYSRSEASVVFFLQRKEDAIRNYGTLLGVGITSNSSKPGSCVDCSLPSSSVVKGVYEIAKVDPTSVAYLEATGAASKVVDAAELNTLSKIFLPKRKKPLLIGSVKSNLGHTESASAFVGIVKMLIAAEAGLVPPNLHYSSPNELVPALTSGKFKVVTEATLLEGDLLAIDNISALGCHGHALIRRNSKSKKRNCQVGVLPPDGLPRLVLLSGREESQLINVLDKVEKMPIDEEFIALTHRTFGKGIKNHMYRGYTVLHDGDRLKQYKQVQPYSVGEGRRPVWVVFSGMGSQWPAMGAELMIFPPFAKAIQFCHGLLEPMGLDLIDIITNPDPKKFDEIVNCFVGITAIQIGLVDVLREVGFEADGIVGHSVGEVGCSYFDGSLTAEQAILGSYLRGKISAESNISGCLMAAVGKGYKQIKDMVPDGIDIACRNSATSCTISGPADLVEEFMDSLSAKGVFGRAVPSGGIAYHSRYIQSFGPLFVEAYKKIVPEPKPRSRKWISSSIPEEDWDTELARYSSAEYHAHNLLSPVLFEDAIEHIPKDAVILEVAPRGLLKAIIQRAISSASYISLTAIGDEGHITLLRAFGKLYNAGVEFSVEKLYPPVEFPVSRGTPSLAPLLTWLPHDSFKKWAFLDKQRILLKSRKLFFNNQATNIYKNPNDYKLNDYPFVPIATYLNIVINMLKEALEKPITRILFENITFDQIVKYGDDKPVYGALEPNIGHWEFTQRNKGIATGNVELFSLKSESPFGKIKPPHQPHETLSNDEVYTYLAEIGLSVCSDYRNILRVTIDESNSNVCASILWKDDWLAFLDSMLTLVIFFNSIKSNKLLFIKKIRQLYIDFLEFRVEKNQVLKVYYDSSIELLWTNGLELHLPLLIEPKFDCFITKKVDFLVPKCLYFKSIECTLLEFYEISVRTILNNLALDNKKLRKLHVYILSDDLKKEEEFMTILDRCNSKALVAALPNEGAMVCAESIDMSSEYCLIFNERDDLDKSLALLKQSRAGFLLSKIQIDDPNFSLIMKKNLRNDTYYFYKTVKMLKKEKPLPHVLLSSPQWESELTSELLGAKNDRVYLVGLSTSVYQIHHIVKHCLLLQNSSKIRFVFIENYAEFMTGKYDEHLSKDLRINVFKGMEDWGTFLFQPLKLLPNSELVPYEGGFLYDFKSIKADGISLSVLGLNLADLTVDSTKLGVFEFSGSKEGKPVCGLATLNEKKGTLEVDPVFIWEKPDNWSHADIVSSLLAYGMAYHMLDREVKLDNLGIILIHNGELPVCQALINLALTRGYEVFTTYDGNLSKKKFILEQFPSLPEKNVLKLDMCLFENLMFLTNGRGVNIVINTVESVRLLLPTAKLVNDRNFNKMYQMSSKPTKPGLTIGLYCFAKNMYVQGFGADCFLKLPNEDKKLIWEMVDSGLRNNEIEPITNTIIRSSSFNVDAITQMKNKDESYKKLVVGMNDGFKLNEINKGLFKCDGEKYCIILGNENAVFFDLIQWHIYHGAKKFIIAVNEISPILAKRLNVLLSHNNCLRLNLCSVEAFRSMDGAKSFIRQVQKTDKIESIFVFGKEYCESLEESSKMLQDTRLILIRTGLQLKQSLSGYRNHLAITVPSDESDLSPIIENLHSLMKCPEPIIYMNEYSSANSDFEVTYLNHWEHLPTSEKEIADIARRSGCPGWKEVRTSSPPFAHSRDVSPVFFLPPLKRGQLDTLLASLYYPAFQAVIPEDFKNLEDLAQQLYKEMDKLKTGMVTLICADWSYYLGLSLARILEKNGKVVSLILFGISNSWADQGIIKSIHLKVSKNIESSDSNLKRLFERGFKILKHRVKLVLESSIQPSPQFAGFCHLIVNEHPDETSLNKLKQLCQRSVQVHCIRKGDFTKMINSAEVSEIINGSVLVEHKDRARNIRRDYDQYEEHSG